LGTLIIAWKLFIVCHGDLIKAIELGSSSKHFHKFIQNLSKEYAFKAKVKIDVAILKN
jgi:hypothetical protein